MKDAMLSKERLIEEAELKKLLRESEREMRNSVQCRSRFKFVNDYFLFALTANTGLRIHEISLLEWKDIHDDYLRVKKGKGGKGRDIFFGAVTKQLLQEFKDIQANTYKRQCLPNDYIYRGQRGRLKRGGIHLRFKYWLKRLGIRQSLGFHSIRHRYGTHSIEEGISLAALKAQMGHESLHTTGIYLHLSKTGREAISKTY